MEHRGIECTVVQGTVWKWSASVADVVIMGHAPSRAAEVATAKKAINRALAVKTVRLVPPPGGTNLP
jgi:hypothetical protein